MHDCSNVFCKPDSRPTTVMMTTMMTINISVNVANEIPYKTYVFDFFYT